MKRILAAIILTILIPLEAYALPAYQEVRRSYVKSNSVLLDRNGAVLHELRTDKSRRRLDWIALADISPALQQAVIQAEDKNFFKHAGVDYKALAVSAFQSLFRQNTRGASTITMQLSSFLDPQLRPRKTRRSLQQKWQQIDEARELDKSWTKAQILEAYLNLVTFRGELQGVAAASRALAGKEPHGLDQTDAAILAALIRAPNASFEMLLQRSMQVVQSLAWRSTTEELSGKLRKIFWGANFIAPQIALAPHVAERLLRDKPKGSRITCTLDAGVQRFALESLAAQLFSLNDQNVCDGVALVLDNKTGQVLAYATSSTDKSTAQYVDGIQAKRQAGSTLKPFLYGIALDRRLLTAAAVLNDAPLDIPVTGGIYQPHNYDSSHRGPINVRTSLASSLNVPAVLTLNLVGPEAILSKLRQMEVKDINESGDYYGPALALGSVDVTLWELTNAYRALANGGRWSKTTLLPGKTSSKNKYILSREAAFIISDILSDREARSSTFGMENSLATRVWSAVKTGTSKDMRDNWCIGYTSRYTVGVWVGNYNGEAMWNVSGVSGAAPVWSDIINHLHRRASARKPDIPHNLVRKEVASNNGPEKHREWFIKGTEPADSVQVVHQYNEKIIYPPAGTIIALDPDIPPNLQKVFLISQSDEKGLRWRLDGSAIAQTGKTVAWTPQKGDHKLELLDGEGKIVDSVDFEVRGSE